MGKKTKFERSQGADSAHPVTKCFEKYSNGQVSDLLAANSADSLRNALDYYREPHPHNSNYKHTILLLDHSFEILFKARIAQESKDAIIKSKGKQGFKTLGFEQSISELENRGITFKKEFSGALIDLHSIRNEIWHFGFLGNKEYLERLMSFCFCVYWVFIMKYFPKLGIRPMLNPGQFELLMSFEDNWHIAKNSAAEIMLNWHHSLDIEQDQYRTVVCKQCINLSFVIDDYTQVGHCKCCGDKSSLTDSKK